MGQLCVLVAEPALPGLAYALLMHEGDDPARGDAPADRPGRQNDEHVKRIGETWQEGELNPRAAAVLEARNRGLAPCG